MVKSDLKDGYLLTLRTGDQFYVCGKALMHPHQQDNYYLSWYNHDLTYSKAADLIDGKNCLDVIAVSYDNVVLWVRGE